MSHLPDLDRVDWCNQHDQLQKQAISYPNQKHRLSDKEHDERAAPTKLPGDHKAQPATHDVAQRIHHRVACVTESCRRGPIVLDHCVRILDQFPDRLDRDRYAETPTAGQSANQESLHPAEHQPMQDVRKAIRVEEGLRSQRTPGIARPKKSAAVTPPRAALMMKLQNGGSQDKPDNQPYFAFV